MCVFILAPPKVSPCKSRLETRLYDSSLRSIDLADARPAGSRRIDPSSSCAEFIAKETRKALVRRLCLTNERLGSTLPDATWLASTIFLDVSSKNPTSTMGRYHHAARPPRGSHKHDESDWDPGCVGTTKSRAAAVIVKPRGHSGPPPDSSIPDWQRGQVEIAERLGPFRKPRTPLYGDIRARVSSIGTSRGKRRVQRSPPPPKDVSTSRVQRFLIALVSHSSHHREKKTDDKSRKHSQKS